MLMTETTESTGRKLTYRDYLRFPDDGNRHELIDGVHYVTTTPSVRHQRIVGNLHARIWQHLHEHGDGEIFVAPLSVVFTMFDVVVPDLVYVSETRKRALTKSHVQGAPDLVIEVLSPSTRRRDEGDKLKLYERSDVVEYWIVAPSSSSVRVFRREKGRLKLAADLSRDERDTLQSPLLSGLSLPLDQVFP